MKEWELKVLERCWGDGGRQHDMKPQPRKIWSSLSSSQVQWCNYSTLLSYTLCSIRGYTFTVYHNRFSFYLQKQHFQAFSSVATLEIEQPTWLYSWPVCKYSKYIGYLLLIYFLLIHLEKTMPALKMGGEAFGNINRLIDECYIVQLCPVRGIPDVHLRCVVKGLMSVAGSQRSSFPTSTENQSN